MTRAHRSSKPRTAPRRTTPGRAAVRRPRETPGLEKEPSLAARLRAGVDKRLVRDIFTRPDAVVLGLTHLDQHPYAQLERAWKGSLVQETRPAAFRDLCLRINQVRPSFFFSTLFRGALPAVRALQHVARHERPWVRHAEWFSPTEEHPQKVFEALLAHLFATW